MSEERIQQECYIWFHNRFPNLRGLLFHVPNGGSRNVVEALNFKKIGVVPGVADFLFMYQGRTYCIELKTPTGSQSEKQKKWQERVEEHHFKYSIVRSKEQFIRLIVNIINS